jgi:hypothetical protein
MSVFGHQLEGEIPKLVLSGLFQHVLSFTVRIAKKNPIEMMPPEGRPMPFFVLFYRLQKVSHTGGETPVSQNSAGAKTLRQAAVHSGDGSRECRIAPPCVAAAHGLLSKNTDAASIIDISGTNGDRCPE